ncbi:hypothetical protein VP01_2021g3, partial [Puccinia sorghi]
SLSTNIVQYVHSSECFHQLLLPALQLVTCVLISLGSASGLATCEVNPKSPTIRVGSGNQTDMMIMACSFLVGMLTYRIGNQELLLITRILQKALLAVGTQEIVGYNKLNNFSSQEVSDCLIPPISFQVLSTDFNAINTGILVVANIVCGSQVWMNKILLATEIEWKNVP